MDDESERRPYSTVNGAWPIMTDPANGRSYMAPLPKLTDAEAITAVKRLLRFAKVKYRGKYRITTGRRHTWPRYGIYSVNAGAGWHSLVHSVSHWCHRRLHPGKKPHDVTGAHAFLERSMIQHVVTSGWLEGKLRRPEKPAPTLDAKRQDRLASIIKRMEAWRRKEIRAVNALSKLAKQKRYYERTIGGG